jgi:hypothetical protein
VSHAVLQCVHHRWLVRVGQALWAVRSRAGTGAPNGGTRRSFKAPAKGRTPCVMMCLQVKCFAARWVDGHMHCISHFQDLPYQRALLRVSWKMHLLQCCRTSALPCNMTI